jgi:hypothetical protein
LHTPEEVLHAAQAYGTVTTRWVNQGVIDDEYGELRNRPDEHVLSRHPQAGSWRLIRQHR